MLLGVVLSGLVCAGLTSGVRRRTGWPWAVTLGLFVWSLIVLGLITLLPANGAPGIVSAEDRLGYCSWDIGGPAPDGFWIVTGGQRLLNTVVFVPSGALLVLVAARWRRTAWSACRSGSPCSRRTRWASSSPSSRSPGWTGPATSRTWSTTSPAPAIGVLLGIAGVGAPTLAEPDDQTAGAGRGRGPA